MIFLSGQTTGAFSGYTKFYSIYFLQICSFFFNYCVSF